MRRGCAIFLTALLLITQTAGAETFEGVLTASDTLTVAAEGNTTVESVRVRAGEIVPVDAVLLEWKLSSVFAPRNGTVARIQCQNGDKADGEVIEILPEERYTVYCTAENAYKDSGAQTVHAGERVWIKCTNDGSHRAVGIVTAETGVEYTVEVTGGELYIGETVWVYRDSGMTPSNRIGKGTAVSTELETVKTEGYISEMKISQGDVVSRGQLLYKWLSVKDREVRTPCGMLITEVHVAPGDTVTESQQLVSGVTADRIRVTFTADEDQTSKLALHMPVRIVYGFDREETSYTGEIESIDYQEDAQNWKVRVIPDDPPLMIGASAEIRTD